MYVRIYVCMYMHVCIYVRKYNSYISRWSRAFHRPLAPPHAFALIFNSFALPVTLYLFLCLSVFHALILSLSLSHAFSLFLSPRPSARVAKDRVLVDIEFDRVKYFH